MPDRPRRPDESMSLLVDTMTSTLDEAYAERAAAVRRDGGRPATPTSMLAGVAVLVALGLLTGIAVSDVRRRSLDTASTRDRLEEQTRARSASSDALAAQAERLRLQVDADRRSALGASGEGRVVAGRLAALSAAGALTAVRGPGLVVTLVDPSPRQDSAVAEGGPPAPRPDSDPGERVLDADLQAVINGLWAAGAEAVALDGRRLTASTAVRSAGDTVLVDFQVVSSPYVVTAIGPAPALERALDEGPVGERLVGLRELYGIGVGVRRERELSLAGASLPDLRSVRVAP